MLREDDLRVAEVLLEDSSRTLAEIGVVIGRSPSFACSSIARLNLHYLAVGRRILLTNLREFQEHGAKYLFAPDRR